MGLSNKAKVVRAVDKDTILTYDDVQLDESLFAYKLRKTIEAAGQAKGTMIRQALTGVTAFAS